MPLINSATEFREYITDFIFSEYWSRSCGIDQELIISEDVAGNEARSTAVSSSAINPEIPVYTNEFWTSKQRAASRLHEISYRACFKPQLPGFFIKILTDEGDLVYDPFTGRGTTIIEAALLGRNVLSNDISPLSRIICEPRMNPPSVAEITERMNSVPYDYNLSPDIDLSMFYDERTASEIMSLKNYLDERKNSGDEDHTDRWIRMVATNRLTGHSPGFFSVYTLPPNQAVLPERQIKINDKRGQSPEYRDTRELVKKKSRSLLKDIGDKALVNLRSAGENAVFLNEDAAETSHIDDESISLTVTSPPFLDIVNYRDDNWLRCWFNSLDAQSIGKKITMARTASEWSSRMQDVFHELFRITKPGGWVAFEVGEVRKGKIRLDDYIVPVGINAGFECAGVLINEQNFTKTSNIWGVSNKKRGTNTNRIVVFRKS
ncbi:site-specific DNA-methyltransferase [Methanoplanus endosymbiosus]|uniref:site-specific DNA-methyltransferase (cytosine-N(4)-specific) n=1 Tax=Methanoplanus endosymbiosus TaxID=33865 RepID=A0A9E7PRJ5_9EURY|nr:site-specific DNA-methyltransferase [Methanoplanus endosymbiosus]UUX93791.1 site-specific DNA-methyltransferase [Methanoplanus endosymbiosus]